ncbi:MAG: ABC transporter permease [Bacteroidales bacterium]|nr:ABC transporter permease [Bacteroidales bacterium]
MTRLPLRIALRYLFARKSYNVINLISAVGVAGMAIGTAALVIILSVFNGFNKIVSESLSDVSPDIVVRPAAGKVFVPDSALFAPVLEHDGIVTLSSTLEEQVFISYEGRQSLARLKGLDAVALEESAYKDHLISGSWQLRKGDLNYAIAGAGIASSLGLNPRFVTPMEVFYPSRTQAPSLSNPAATLRKQKLLTGGVFSVNAETDAKVVLVPLEVMRELLEYPEEVSALEIWTVQSRTEEVEKWLTEYLGAHFKVLNRYRQNESVFKMMRYEKLAIFLILIFVVIIIAFNIYSSLKMLVIEKQDDTGTLRSLGAPEGMLRKIFLLEGWLVSLLGMVIGLVIGVAVVLLQERFGFVPMPGNFLVQAYPVVLKFTDILWIVLGVAGVGYLMALIPSRKV